MDSEQKFWLSLWTMAAVAILLFAIILTAYFHGKNEQIKEMVVKGKISPAEARIALSSVDGRDILLMKAITNNQPYPNFSYEPVQ